MHKKFSLDNQWNCAYHWSIYQN